MVNIHGEYSFRLVMRPSFLYNGARYPYYVFMEAYLKFCYASATALLYGGVSYCWSSQNTCSYTGTCAHRAAASDLPGIFLYNT